MRWVSVAMQSKTRGCWSWLVLLAGIASPAGAQSINPFRVLELPEPATIACRAVPPDEMGVFGVHFLGFEFRFQPTGRPTPMTFVDDEPGVRFVTAMFDSTGGLHFLQDQYMDSAIVSAAVVSLIPDSGLVGKVLELKTDSAFEVLLGPDFTVTRLTSHDSTRTARLAEWLWQRRCGRRTPPPG